MKCIQLLVSYLQAYKRLQSKNSRGGEYVKFHVIDSNFLNGYLIWENSRAQKIICSPCNFESLCFFHFISKKKNQSFWSMTFRDIRSNLLETVWLFKKLDFVTDLDALCHRFLAQKANNMQSANEWRTWKYQD